MTYWNCSKVSNLILKVGGLLIPFNDLACDVRDSQQQSAAILKYSGRGAWDSGFHRFLCEYASPRSLEDVCPWGIQRRCQPQGVSLGQLCLVTVRYTPWKKKHTQLFSTSSSWHKPPHNLCCNHYCTVICIWVQSIFSWYMTKLTTGDMYFIF